MIYTKNAKKSPTVMTLKPFCMNVNKSQPEIQTSVFVKEKPF